MTTRKSAALLAGAAGPRGSGYSRVGVYAIGHDDGTRTGTLEVHYSSGAGKNCALTYGYGAYANTMSWKRVSISRADGSRDHTDAGYYTHSPVPSPSRRPASASTWAEPYRAT
ncbi:hypothetical protein AB0K48_43910 [Nonomuraea sp. NPDC055795]